MKSLWKTATVALETLREKHRLAALRKGHRREFGVLMFHSFQEADRANVEADCAHITRYFEPVSLSAIVESLGNSKKLPDHAVTITIDDGYRNFLLHGHPIFRRHRIPTTLFAVAGFSDGRLWLWPDQIEFGLMHTSQKSVAVNVNGEPVEFALTTPGERTVAVSRVRQALKEVPNDRRLRFLAEFGALCGVEIPPLPPASCAPMSWDDLRAVAADGVEIGCHSDSHPILSRLATSHELDREIRGAGRQMEERLGIPVRHFCYPNGREIDIGEAAIRCVREAGYASAVTCTWGFNTIEAEPLQIRRIPFESSIPLDWGVELLAGLHM